MSEYLIEVSKVSKMYKLFHSPRARVLEVLGFPVSKKSYDEFWALKDIDLNVMPGERVGIIGRNGAGKSTLLKVIAQLLKPTTGTVKVRGKVQALLELGTGFHPEFSGRENIIAYLGYQGVTGKEAARRMEEIIDFSELENFIDAPLKTYSSGMYARLAFSVATSIQPEILIIDEVLGAGDAFFAGKCVDRMKKLTGNGATVLFVSHDMSSVERMCERAIWLDRGKIIMSGDTLTLSKAYAEAIRKREALRLQAKNSMMNVTTLEKIRQSHNSPIQMIFRLADVEEGLDVARVDMEFNGHHFAGVDVGGPQDTAYTTEAFVLMDKNLGEWGPPIKDNKSISMRHIKNSNSGAIVFNMDGLSPSSEIKVYWKLKGGACNIQCFDGEIYVNLMRFNGSDEWVLFETNVPSDLIERFLVSQGLILPSTHRDASLALISDDNNEDKPLSQISGKEYDVLTGHLIFEEVAILGSSDLPQHIFKSFDPFKIRIKYKVLRNLYDPEFVIAFYKEGICALQSLSRLEGRSLGYLQANTSGEITFQIDELPLGMGRYVISIGVFPPLDGQRLDTEQIAYLLQDRRYEVKVEQPEDTVFNLGMARCRCKWKID